MVPGQVRTADKSNDITAIPELLDALLLKRAIVTIDAMGRQQSIAQKIVDGKADYVLAVKGNHGKLEDRVHEAFAVRERWPGVYRCDEHLEIGKDHGPSKRGAAWRSRTRLAHWTSWIARRSRVPWRWSKQHAR